MRVRIDLCHWPRITFISKLCDLNVVDIDLNNEILAIRRASDHNLHSLVHGLRGSEESSQSSVRRLMTQRAGGQL